MARAMSSRISFLLSAQMVPTCAKQSSSILMTPKVAETGLRFPFWSQRRPRCQVMLSKEVVQYSRGGVLLVCPRRHLFLSDGLNHKVTAANCNSEVRQENVAVSAVSLQSALDHAARSDA